MEGVGFVIILSVALTIAYAYCVVLVDIEAIKSDWERRRCDVATMMVAGLAKPSSDSRTATEFASDNFKYCTGKMAQDSLKVALAPLYTVAEQQAQTVKNLNGVMNNTRATLNSRKSWWDTIFAEKYGMAKRIGLHMFYVMEKFQNVFGRLNAIFISAFYATVSLSTLLQNFFEFFRQVLKVATPILFVTSIPLGAFAESTRDKLDDAMFCIDPEAKIVLADGTTKLLKDIRCGDHLGGARGTTNSVQGILEADATKSSLVRIRGVLMSGDHRVLYKSSWILAKKHPEAIPTDQRLERLICLNTTTHEVPVVDEAGTILWAGDWEELSTLDSQHEWIEYVNRVLNPGIVEIQRYPTAVPLVSPTVTVVQKDIGPVPINTIQIGDEILSGDRYTKVVGTYKGQIECEEEPLDPEWISDGVWAYLGSRLWATGSGLGVKRGGERTDGVYLITEAETFTIQRNGKYLFVRDFTELGASRMEEAYEWLDEAINRK
jgi:hypothetical protein